MIRMQKIQALNKLLLLHKLSNYCSMWSQSTLFVVGHEWDLGGGDETKRGGEMWEKEVSHHQGLVTEKSEQNSQIQVRI